MELYFKSFVGFIRSIEEFNYKEVKKEHATAARSFTMLTQSNEKGDEEYSLAKELDDVFKGKEKAKTEHFYTIQALTLAHANLVLISHEDEDCMKYIEKYESKKESVQRTIEQKEAILDSMLSKEELEQTRAQLTEAREIFKEQAANVDAEIKVIREQLDHFEENYFAEL